MGVDLSRPRVRARLETPVAKPIDRVHFLPARVRYDGGEYVAETLPWKGSADLFVLTRADGFVIVPIHTTYPKGASVECLLL
jgi:molybdopterin biosynthesis enzyme